MGLRFALLTLLLAGAAHAQMPGVTVTTLPAAPVPGQPVTIVVTTECGCPAHVAPITRNGFTFDIPYNPICVGTCAPTHVATYDAGPLEAGVYTVRHFPESDPAAPRLAIGEFTVVSVTIPASDARPVWALVLSLAALGFVALRR